MNEKVLATANAVMDEALTGWKTGGVVVFEMGRDSAGRVVAFVDKPEMPKFIDALDDAKRYAPEEAQSDLERLLGACRNADTDPAGNNWPAFPDPTTIAKLAAWARPAGWAFKIDMPGGLS